MTLKWNGSEWEGEGLPAVQVAFLRMHVPIAAYIAIERAVLERAATVYVVFDEHGGIIHVSGDSNAHGDDKAMRAAGLRHSKQHGDWTLSVAPRVRLNPIRAISQLSEEWSDEKLKMTSWPEWATIPVWRSVDVAWGASKIRLHIKKNRARLLWWTGSERSPTAAGLLYSGQKAGKPFLVVSFATVRADARQRGVYSAVLRALAEIIRLPIESDTSMTAGTIGAWRRAGARVVLRDGEDVFRIEPTGQVYP